METRFATSKRLMLAGLAVVLGGCAFGVAVAVLTPDAALLAVLPVGLGVGAGALLILGGLIAWGVQAGTDRRQH